MFLRLKMSLFGAKPIFFKKKRKKLKKHGFKRSYFNVLCVKY